jgi:hypothetical protein
VNGAVEHRFASLAADMREIRLVLSRMEARVEGIDARLRAVETNVAQIAAKVARLPTVRMFVTSIVGLALGRAGIAVALARLPAPL